MGNSIVHKQMNKYLLIISLTLKVISSRTSGQGIWQQSVLSKNSTVSLNKRMTSCTNMPCDKRNKPVVLANTPGHENCSSTYGVIDQHPSCLVNW
jgi:hypothetical protein